MIPCEGATMTDDAPLTYDDCINGGEGGCSGLVEYRMPLSGTGKSFPRCDHHWAIRLKTQDRLRRDYPDSPIPPSWFDPAAAGETWDDDY